MNKQQHQLMTILQKLRVFQGLSLAEAERLMGICTFKRFEAGSQIYGKGDHSDEMLVLVAGKLSVENELGEQLGEVSPGQSTGEMGVFTGHPRSATIRAQGDSAGLVIKRESLKGMMAQDTVMSVTILNNVVSLLSDRLADANDRVYQLMASGASIEDSDTADEST